MKYLILLFCFLGSVTIWSQPNIGLVHSIFGTSEGYTLFSPESNTSVYLVNNCGEKVNEWTFSEQPGITCYLLENGNLLRAGRDSLEVRDWSNSLVWSYAINLNELNQHHDIEPLPNGNILIVSTDRLTAAEIILEGRDPLNVGPIFILDKILELMPFGTNDAAVVWEWKFVDHLIQDIDATKNNFGAISDHPELLDVNFDNQELGDYTHVNSVDYNPELDQILISARNMSEVYIIDHSTTTAEAASHSGGDSNRGGDFLWRWGNSQVYGQGGVINQKIYQQHDAKWVEQGYLDEGKISVFNNGGDGTATFSSVHLLEPKIENDVYTLSNNVFLPIDFDWSWSGELLNDTVLEGRKSGGHSLPNGNFIICETTRGMVSEIIKTGTHVWSYVNPHGVSILDQNDVILSNTMFRAEKYPIDYLGFVGQDMSTAGIIENQNSITDLCILTLGIDKILKEQVQVVNPVTNSLFRFTNEVSLDEVRVVDLQGRIVYFEKGFKGLSFNLDLPPSIYVMIVSVEGETQVIKIVVQ